MESCCTGIGRKKRRRKHAWSGGKLEGRKSGRGRGEKGIGGGGEKYGKDKRKAYEVLLKVLIM